MAEYDNVEMLGDESFLPPGQLDVQRALAMNVRGQQANRLLANTARRNPALTMPTSGVPQRMAAPAPAPQPAPSPVAAAPAPDYRSLAYKAMQDAAAAGEATPEETDEGNRKLVLALALGARGGEAFQQPSGLMLKQAMEDPERRAQRRQQRLEAQGKIYESMAQHSETTAERERAARAADQYRRDALESNAALRREIAGAANQTRRDIAGAKADAAAEKAAQGRQLPAHAVEAINKAEGKVAQFSNLLSSWKPEYGGLGTSVGNLSGKFNPYASEHQRDQAAWWQQYQEFVNDMRHGQFGSALTPTEKAEFEKAIVTADTDPRVVAGYLTKQKKLAEVAHQRALQSYARGGFNVSGFAGGEQQPGAPAAPGAPTPAPGGNTVRWDQL